LLYSPVSAAGPLRAPVTDNGAFLTDDVTLDWTPATDVIIAVVIRHYLDVIRWPHYRDVVGLATLQRPLTTGLGQRQRFGHASITHCVISA